jgi:hypothetical protein
VYWVFGARLTVGSRVTTRVVALYVTAAPTVVLPVLSVNVVPEYPCTGSENVADTFDPTATAVALAAGVRAVTVGAVVSAAAAVVKAQVTVASGLPAASRIPEPPPVSVAVYWVLAARLAVGFRVAVRLVAS